MEIKKIKVDFNGTQKKTFKIAKNCTINLKNCKKKCKKLPNCHNAKNCQKKCYFPKNCQKIAPNFPEGQGLTMDNNEWLRRQFFLTEIPSWNRCWLIVCLAGGTTHQMSFLYIHSVRINRCRWINHVFIIHTNKYVLDQV